jgi:hypothetical protein
LRERANSQEGRTIGRSDPLLSLRIVRSPARRSPLERLDEQERENRKTGRREDKGTSMSPSLQPVGILALFPLAALAFRRRARKATLVVVNR